MNEARQGDAWERTKFHLKEAKYRIESLRVHTSVDDWHGGGRKTSSRLSSIISGSEAEPLRRFSRFKPTLNHNVDPQSDNLNNDHNHASNGFKDKPVPKPELHM